MRLRNESDDAFLIARCLAGEKRAFGFLVERHWPRIARLLRRRGEPADVDDLLQEAFLQAYLGLASLREPAHFGAWVYAIARNLLYSRWRKQSLDLVSLEMLPQVASDRRRSPEQVAERREARQQLHRAIDSLRPAEREAVRLVYLLGFSHREAAVRLGTSVGAIKVRVHRGRRHLQTILGGEFGPIVVHSDLEATMIPVTVHDILVKTQHTPPAQTATHYKGGPDTR